MAKVVVHLTASTFFGGPERQMLGLARALEGDGRTVFLSFREGGLCRPFLAEARRLGFEADELDNDTPRFRAATAELAGRLLGLSAEVLCVHSYKAGLLGRAAARRAGIPVVAVSRGWTAESSKVRIYETLDRLNLRFVDRVVCVSEGQAAKVRRAGVPPRRVEVIHNAVDPARFGVPDPAAREELARLFAGEASGPIVGAAGRLSPEKGFGVLIEAAALALRGRPAVRFVLFGDGCLRAQLAHQITRLGLDGRFVLAGFRGDLDRILPHLDLMALSSYTEGLPNVLLEAAAAGVPAVATAVGGVPEVIEDGVGGLLVPPGDPAALARGLLRLLDSGPTRRVMGEAARRRVVEHFTFEVQGRRYDLLFEELAAASARRLRGVSARPRAEASP